MNITGKAALASVLVVSLVSAQNLGGLLVGKKPVPGVPPAAKPGAPMSDKSAEDLYLDMKDFAEGLYNKQTGAGDIKQDSDFKRRVDTEYEKLKRKDAELAYSVNLSAHSEVKRVMEDRFRVFSGLYDNLLVQDLLNRTGQSIIPPDTGRLYAFKLKADPIPGAETLSTGTIYITTGLVALLKTKAQLAYILAHEAAHVYHNDYRTEIMLNLASEEYAKERGENVESITRKVSMISSLVGMGVGAGVGGAFGNAATGAVLGLAGGAVAGMITSAIVDRGEAASVKDWNRIQEDEADRTAFEWVMRANLDVTEIPTVYKALKDAGDRDQRVTLGFLGRSNRVRERAKKIDEMVVIEKGKAEFGKKPFVRNDPDFDILLAEVKRDNGILAFEYDMLDVARENLRDAVAIKTTDPTALYFYARILKETAHSDQERAEADTFFRRAADSDARNLNYGAKLHRAVAMLKPDATSAEKTEAVGLLKSYLEDYYLSSMQDSQRASYPPHLETIYDFMSRLGEFVYVLDGKKVAADREAAALLAQKAGGAVIDVKPDEAAAKVQPAKLNKTPAPPRGATPARPNDDKKK